MIEPKPKPYPNWVMCQLNIIKIKSETLNLICSTFSAKNESKIWSDFFSAFVAQLFFWQF